MKEQQRTSLVSARPRATEIQLHVFGRPLHPELYEPCESRSFERGNYRAKVEILRAGHVIHWCYEDARRSLVLSEIVTSASSPLPGGRQLLGRRIEAREDHQIDWRRGIRYHVTAQTEAVDAKLLWMVQNELCRDEHEGMLHRFGSSGRISLGGLSYIYVETRGRSFSVQSLHTFPDDSCLIKVESVFLVPQT